MATFPANQAADQQSWVVYLDPAATQLAPVFDAVSGVPLAGSVIVASQEHLWPLFTCPGALVLYAYDATGRIVAVQAIVGAGPSITVTGSKSSGAAMTSLLAALVALGVSVTDGTVA